MPPRITMLLVWATNIYKHKQTWQSYGTGSAWLIHECFESLFLCYGRAGGITFATFMALLKGMVLNACLEHHTADMGRQGQNEANIALHTGMKMPDCYRGVSTAFYHHMEGMEPSAFHPLWLPQET